MKKLFSAITLLCLAQWLPAQNLPNRGFENWVTDTLYETTDVWTSVYDDVSYFGIEIFNRSDDAQDGSFSVRLSNDTIYNDSTMMYDTAFSYVFQGEVQNGPSGGFAYSSPIDSITGWYKCDMGAGDSSLVIVQLFSDTDTVFNVFTIGGVQNNWTRFSFPLAAFNDTLESVFVGFTSSDPNLVGGITFDPSSWIMYDNVAFTHSSSTPAAIPDQSFEQWSASTYEDPEGWYTFNQWSALANDTLNVVKTTDAASGNYAMKLTTRFDSTFGAAATFVSIAPFFSSLNGVPFSEIPTGISGQYKFNVAQPWDTAIVHMRASRWDATGDSTILVMESVHQLPPQNAYTSFAFSFDTTGVSNETIDSINLIIYTSQWSFSTGGIIGSELFLDDLWLDSECAYADTTSLFAEDTIGVNAGDVLPATYTYSGNYSTYSWSSGDTSSTILLDSFGYTNLTLVVEDNSGCVISDEVTFEIYSFSSTDEKLAAKIGIYPNPAADYVTVDFTAIPASLEKEIAIHSLSGKQIMTTFVTDQMKVLTLNELPSGVYFMKIRIGEELTTYKVVKK